MDKKCTITKHVHVEATTIHECLSEFSEWLDRHNPCALIAHNASFDARMLISACNTTDIDIRHSVLGFVDTLPIFKKSISWQADLRTKSP